MMLAEGNDSLAHIHQALEQALDCYQDIVNGACVPEEDEEEIALDDVVAHMLIHLGDLSQDFYVGNLDLPLTPERRRALNRLIKECLAFMNDLANSERPQAIKPIH
jgi:hypothetical protein